MTVFRRHFDFGLWAFEDAADLADYLEWLGSVVANIGEYDPEVKVEANVYRREREPPMALDEFRDRADEFPFEDLGSLTAEVGASVGGLSARFEMEREILTPNDSATVTILGWTRNASSA